MMRLARRYSTPAALLLVLFFAWGAAFSPVVSASQIEADACCDKDPYTNVPFDEGECFDCNCLSCQSAINNEVAKTSTLSAANTNCFWLQSEISPSDFIHAIDYPPEAS